jgi:threonine/homoserine/homoserine lactone efflux protein
VLGFAGAAAFQWVNPKAWLIGIGAAGEYMAPDLPLVWQLGRIFVVFMIVGLPCLMVWALIGSGARRLLRSPDRLRAVNVAMGALLLLSVVPVLLEDW